MPPKKPSEGSTLFHKDHHKEVLFQLLPALILLGALAQQLFVWWDSLNLYADSGIWERFLIWAAYWWPIFKMISGLLSVAALLWGLYAYYKLRQIKHAEEKIFGHETADVFLEVPLEPENKRWQKVIKHAYSDNPAEWRLAIMDADVMLDEALRKMGYQGEGVAELLKAVEPTDMLTLQAAWDAHRVRNRVAHDGPAFELTDRETKRVITLYEAVFKELKII